MISINPHLDITENQEIKIKSKKLSVRRREKITYKGIIHEQ